MVRNNSPAARDKFASSCGDLFPGLGYPDAAAFVAPVKFVMDPELTANPFAKEVDGAAQIDQAGGDPEDATRKQLIPMGNRCGRTAIKSWSSEFYQISEQADTDPGRSHIEQGFGSGQPMGLVRSCQRPAKQDAGEEETARVEEGKEMEMPVEAGAIPGHQGVDDGRHLPEPEDADAHYPVQPRHGGKPAGQAESQAALCFGAFPHGQYREGRCDQQKDNMTCHMRTEDEFAAGKEGELCQGHTN